MHEWLDGELNSGARRDPETPVDVSIVLPSFNEAQTLPVTIGSLVAGMRTRPWRFEIIVVENGSTDNTAYVAADLLRSYPELRYMSLPDADYGRALKTGALAARGGTLVFFDVDYYSLTFIDQALLLLDRPGGPGLVVGSKRVPESHDARPLSRRLVTEAFAIVLRVFFGLALSDTHGIKAMRRVAVIETIRECRFGSDLFDTELILRFERRGLPAAELPVLVAEQRPSRTPIARRVIRCIGPLLALRVSLWRSSPRPSWSVDVRLDELGPRSTPRTEAEPSSAQLPPPATST